MATEKDPDKESEKDKPMDYEFIDEKEIESVKRGRKPRVIAEMVAFFAKAKVGQMAKIGSMAIDSALYAELDSARKANDNAKVQEIVSEIKSTKAAISATIRTQAKIANWKKVSIKWDTKGTPYAKREA